MKGLKLILSAILMGISSYAASPVVILDGSSRSPVEGATVISSRGMILGISDLQGAISVDERKDFPLTIRCVGFEPVTTENVSDTILLQPATYELSEIAVNADERPIMKVLSYVREYCSGATPNDTLQLFADYMMVSYHTDENKNVKGYKKGDVIMWPRAVRRAARFANSEGKDSVASPENFDNVTYLSFYDKLTRVPGYSITEPENIINGASEDTVMGKYYVNKVFKKNDRHFSISIDGLADHEGHRWSPNIFKLFGMTLEMDHLKATYLYNVTGDTVYNLPDFVFCAGSIHALAKGKMFKWLLGTGRNDVELDCYAELYPVDIQYLTVEEYKEDRKERKGHQPIPFREPKNLQPLPPAVKTIIDRVKEKSRNN